MQPWPAPCRQIFPAIVGAIIVSLAGTCTVRSASPQHGALALRAPSPEPARLVVEGRSFKVSSEPELMVLSRWLDTCIERVEAGRKEFQLRRQTAHAWQSLKDASRSELEELLREPPADFSGRTLRGLKQLRALATEALRDPGSGSQTRHWMMEVAAALQNNRRPPAPAKMEIGQPPLMFLDYSHNPIACGESPAVNVPTNSASDLSQVDPPDSSFWTRPTHIAALDLYHGFQRDEVLDFRRVVWNYAAPKTSYGGCPGFEVSDGERVLKVKFAETRSEPFAARIFSALGFNVDPTDHARELKVRYDRRLLREFHLRKPVQTGIYAFWMVRVHTIDLQKRHDPFDSIDRAVLTNGVALTSAELRKLLFVDPDRPHPEDDPQNFRPEVEAQIDYLVTVPANVQARQRSERSIGPWTFDALGHEDLRELRGAGLLGAWIGWFDSRFENNRLRIVRGRHGQPDELRHFFTDLGGGLGKAIGPLSRVCESPNQLEWIFTRPRIIQGPGRMTIPFRIEGYQPIEDTLAFERMTWDDARWMARWIGKLSENQIRAALIASGFDAAHVHIYTEKLICRRDRMIEDLELAGEIPLLRPEGSDRKLTRSGEDLPSAVLPNGQIVYAIPGISRLQDGLVYPMNNSRGDRLGHVGVTGDFPKANR